MRALVLSGGGSKGAYEVGALKYLIGDLGINYDIFAGVSIGAINAAYLAQFKDTKTAIVPLEKLWDGLDSSKVYKHWWFPYVAAIWKASLYDSSPAQRLVRGEISPNLIRNSGKKLRIGATGLDTGEYRVFDETYPDICGAVLASSAFPGMLTPVELEGQLWTDGGVKSTTPLKAAIEAGATTIDVVLCSPAGDASTAFSTKTTALGVGVRAISLMSDQIEAADLEICGMVNKLVVAGAARPGQIVVDLRIIRPNNGLVKNPLDFTPSLLASMKVQGYTDAKEQFKL